VQVSAIILPDDDKSAMVPEPIPLGASVRHWQDGNLLDQQNKGDNEINELE